MRRAGCPSKAQERLEWDERALGQRMESKWGKHVCVRASVHWDMRGPTTTGRQVSTDLRAKVK